MLQELFTLTVPKTCSCTPSHLAILVLLTIKGCLFTYVISQNLFMGGSNAFYRNKAENGAAIYASNHSVVTFNDHSVTKFESNTVTNNGGAIYLNNCASVILEGSSIVESQNNNARKNGGSVYLDNNSGIRFKGDSKVHFTTTRLSLKELCIAKPIQVSCLVRSVR